MHFRETWLTRRIRDEIAPLEINDLEDREYDQISQNFVCGGQIGLHAMADEVWTQMARGKRCEVYVCSELACEKKEVGNVRNSV